MVDDKKVIFGTDNDAHIEYNEDEDDHLVISGSSSGMVLSGTMVQVSGNMVVKFPNYFAVTSNPSQNASSFYVQTGQGVQFHNGADNGGVTIRDAGDVHISDDKKIIFGINEDSHIEYNENGDDFLVISGSAKGIALSGTNVAIDGRLIGAGDEDTYIDLSLTANDQINLVAGGNYYATFLNGTPKIINFNALQEDIDFKINQDAGLALHMSGSDGILHSHYGIVVHDDKKVIFGGNSDGHIEYNENGDDFLIVSGSSSGVAISGSVVKLDGTIHANAGFDGVHRITGSMSITGSHDVNLKLKSTGSVSIRLEADSDNNNEAHNPFIELVQDGGATDYTIGLTQGNKNPEGAAILNMTDNALAFGSNIAVGSTNVGHVQFYNRATASFGLFDRGSTNHGPADLQGFRVGVGPVFAETNFPKGRVEIHNTSTSPVPALFLTVSGTSQHAALVHAANTTKIL